MKQRVLIVAGLVLLGFLLLGHGRADIAADSEVRILADMQFLASDQCEGRGITTKGIELAAEHIARQFQKAGLKPAGTDGSYFQPFTLVTGGKAGKSQLVLKGPQGQSIALEATKHFTPSLQGSSGKLDAPLVFAGYGITSTEPKYDDYEGLDVTGKVVVVLNGTPRRGHRYADVFAAGTEGRANPLASLRAKFENAEKRKAAGILVINEASTSSRFLQGMGRPGGISMRDGEPSKLPMIQIRRELVDPLLVAATGDNLGQLEKAIDAELKPRSAVLTGWTCNLETEITHNRLTVKNVVGVLEGRGPLAKETVVIGAHYDHVGFGMGRGFGGIGGGVSGPGAPGGAGFPVAQMGSSAIHNGADDNASGTATLLEVARRLGLRKEQDGRRVVFIAFTAEESGLIGSAYYVRKPLFPMKDTTTMINMDMVGRLQDNKLLVGGLGSAKGFEQLVLKLNEKHQFELLKEMSGEGPSDHSSFYRQRVPVIQFFTGFHEQYHRPTDKVETINISGMRRIADLASDVITETRTLPQRPEYLKTGTFNRNTTLWSGSPATGVLPNYTDKKEGVLLADVVANTAAARAGMKKGDRLLSLKGQPVKNATEYLAMARRLKGGEKVDVTIEREGKTQTLQLTLSRASAGFADPRFGWVADMTDIKDGVLLTEVPENTPAANAGLKKGDRIVGLDGEQIQDMQTYMSTLRTIQPGDAVQLLIARDGKTQVVQMRTGTAPTTRGGGSLNAASRLGATPDFQNESQDGVVLSRIRDDSPASAAGLRAGDKIVAINGQEVKDVRAYVQAMMNLKEGEKVEIAVVRGGKTEQVQVMIK